MTENFDRAPGAGRARMKPTSPGLADVGDGDAKFVFNQREPLRQPRTSPPLTENITNSIEVIGADSRTPSKPHQQGIDKRTPASQEKNLDSLVKTSILSVNAAEFYPSSFHTYQEPVSEDISCGYGHEPSLAELVEEFLSHLNASPGSFETEIEYIANMLNSWVTTEETLQELVELIYTQSTAIPNFSYTGARLCNFLSHNLTFNSPSGNFRQLLLKRCQTEYEQRDVAVTGDQATQKRFHAYVLFLGELYLRLELKSAKGPPSRAEILLTALGELMNSLFSHPEDGNLICAVKLLKLTGSVLEDAWKERRKSDMDQLVKRIKNIVVDAKCSRDVKQMLLQLLELRSSNWGRVHAAAAAEATPDNDPNYFMNEPTFYTADGTPFTAADPDYSEKYQEILDREDDYFPEDCEENGNESSFYDEDEMDPEIEEAFEKFCLESERKRRQ
ncbi:polyadenylate-binding protein-interacting protein 1 [Esox lucius]|uniref:Polyadenylate-binding protein-interacting protein 1 n=1 Tax=Esox lucius TaxID=8010 RepID=A0A3P8XCB8_ESOLU|nr:polyadenylate-binding protein-interacting protein 1 [Esox lucius]XP_019908051.1 polyadenylate-binding protein-interacting protein 1 [Esox lucius]XP_019908052.1 polyadenylate-binding protein-interacting protein 1 [Esox lucius]XP_019908053.1 polyadenylate-binding protein-interacting protein 1 [Esox lucius]